MQDSNDITGPKPGRMVQIADLIAELQEIQRKFGNTCCFISGLSWGSVALWHESWAEALKSDPTPEVIEACTTTACDHTAREKGIDDMTFAEMDDSFKKQWRTFTAIVINTYRKAIHATA
jgi:hypothetical protein